MADNNECKVTEFMNRKTVKSPAEKRDILPEMEENPNKIGDVMAVKLDDYSFNLDAQILKLRHSLDDWKEILLTVKSVLLWDKHWYPTAIIGGCTIFFMILWLLDPSILSTVSLVGLTLTISDYLVPLLARSLFKAELWSNAKEEQLEEICRTIIVYKAKIRLSCESFLMLRTTKPKLYYGIAISSLSVLAWIGNAFNNLFLTYVLVTVLLLVPGMEYHGILHKYGMIISQKCAEFTANARMKMGQVKQD